MMWNRHPKSSIQIGMRFPVRRRPIIISDAIEKIIPRYSCAIISRNMRRFLFVSWLLLQVGASLGFAGPATNKPSKLRLQASRAAQKKASRTKWIASRTDAIDANTNDDTMVLFSPSKINLFLRIIRKREDGFHDLASLFQAVGFGDTLELTKLEEGADQDDFTCNMKGVPTNMSNLVLRALELMREKTGVSQYFKAKLIKQVPAQAGLGGGSANAATAMWGANQLMGNPASLEDVSKAVMIIFVVYLVIHNHLTCYIFPQFLLLAPRCSTVLRTTDD
jgi:hypothetical protein